MNTAPFHHPIINRPQAGLQRGFIPAFATLFSLLLSSSVHAANPNLFFTELPYYGSGVVAQPVAAADINGDGKNDYVAFNRVRFGVGDGTFGPTFGFDVGYGAQVRTGDLTGDGNLEIVIPNLSASKTLNVVMNAGRATQSAISTPIGLVLKRFALTDFNGDGKLDVVGIGYKSFPLEGYVLTAIGNGDGSFSSITTTQCHPLYLYMYPQDITVADFNGDGRPDFAITELQGQAIGMVTVFTNNGNGTFTRLRSFATGPVASLTSGDFNHDGIADIAFNMVKPLDGVGSLNQNIGVVFGNGNGTFGTVIGGSGTVVDEAYISGITRYAATSLSDSYMATYTSLIAADMTGDGELDLVGMTVMADYPYTRRLAILRGSASGVFSLATNLNLPAAASSSSYGPPEIAIAEIDGDGSLDILLGTASGMYPLVTGRPVLNSVFFDSVTSNSARLLANIAGSGSGITRRGFVYERSISNQNPRLGDPFTLVVDDPILTTGPFGQTLTGLSPNTSYSFTAFAQNATGVTHSAAFQFTTAPAPGAGSLVVTTLVDEDNGSSDPALGTGTSLREAVAYANAIGGNPIITFSPNLFASGPATLTLTLGQLTLANLTGSTTVRGPGASLLTLTNNGSTAQRLLRVTGPSAEISGLRFHGARASVNGVAISNQVSGSLTLADCVFSDNGGEFVSGGALENTTSAKLQNCTFSANFARSGGAIINYGPLILLNCTFCGNAANDSNASGQGGAISNDPINSAERLVIVNSTFATNTASGTGGAIHIASNRAKIYNSLFAGNTAPTADDISGTLAAGSNNLLGASPAAVFSTGVLANNGGSAPTLALKFSGPAINAGSNSAAVDWSSYTTATTIPLANDQHGFPRIVGGTVDVGAYEAPARPTIVLPTATDLTGTSAILGATVSSDGYSPITEAGILFSKTALNPNPTLGAANVSIAALPTTTGAVGGNVNSLDPLTSYSFVIYAMNEVGVAYSPVGVFSTVAADADGDTLTDAQEATLGTNPLLIDTDGDGFNDPTEVLAGTNPLSALSTPGATYVSRVLGYGPARGLDLTGSFLYAFNVGPAGAAGQAGDATFTADTAPGITVQAPNNPIGVWNNPDFGSTAGDTALETVYQSIRWANSNSGDSEARKLKVDLANLVVGRKYKLQLLFGEAGATGRRFDVLVNGNLVANDFAPTDAQGAANAVTAASAIVHEFTATSTTLNIVLDGVTDVASVPGINRDSYLNGATLEDITPPTALASWRTLHGLATNGSQDLANPSGDGVENLLKFGFNMAPNPDDLNQPNVTTLAPGGSAGLPRITRDGNGRLVFQFVRRKAATNPGIGYVVETSSDLAMWTALDLGGASVESIDATWERVTVTDPTTGAKRFGRLSLVAF